MGLDISHYIPCSKKQSDYYTKDELMINPSYINRYEDLFSINEDGLEVLYFEQIGYQRKQMSSEFYDTFVNNKLYFTLNDVERASTFLSAEKDLLNELKKAFSANFITNFTEGKSIFTADW